MADEQPVHRQAGHPGAHPVRRPGLRGDPPHRRGRHHLPGRPHPAGGHRRARRGPGGPRADGSVERVAVHGGFLQVEQHVPAESDGDRRRRPAAPGSPCWSAWPSWPRRSTASGPGPPSRRPRPGWPSWLAQDVLARSRDRHRFRPADEAASPTPSWPRPRRPSAGPGPPGGRRGLHRLVASPADRSSRAGRAGAAVGGARSGWSSRKRGGPPGSVAGIEQRCHRLRLFSFRVGAHGRKPMSDGWRRRAAPDNGGRIRCVRCGRFGGLLVAAVVLTGLAAIPASTRPVRPAAAAVRQRMVPPTHPSQLAPSAYLPRTGQLLAGRLGRRHLLLR